MARTKTTVRPEPKTVADRIEMLCQHGYGMREKPSRQYIKKAMAEKYDYTNEANIKKTLGQMVKFGKLIQEGQTFYAKGFILEDDEEEFESKHDYMPGFLEALGELADIYEDQDDFRKTALRRAITALEGQIITAVEDIKLFNLIDLNGVGKSTLEMLEEFIDTGKIKRLVDLKATPDQVEWFASLTKEQAGFIQDWWDEEGERKWATT